MLCYQCGASITTQDKACANCSAKLEHKKTTHNVALPTGRGFQKFTSQLQAITPDLKLFVSQGEEVAERFVIGAFLGCGLLGQVYEAHDVLIDADVVLKVFSHDLLEGLAQQDRFQKELSRARAMTHKGLVRLHDAGIYEHYPWVSMQRLEGLTLDKISKLRFSKNEVFSAQEVQGFLTQIVDALSCLGVEYAHGDLKPQNVLFLSDKLKVMDYFIATAIDSTIWGPLHKEHAYLAPEVKRGERPTPRADVFSLGMLLELMLFGSNKAVVDKVQSVDVVQGSLRELCAHATAQEASHRMATPADLLEQLILASTQSFVSEAVLSKHLARCVTTPSLSRPMARVKKDSSLVSGSPPAALIQEDDLVTLEVPRIRSAPNLADLLPTNELDRGDIKLSKPREPRREIKKTPILAPALGASTSSQTPVWLIPILVLLCVVALLGIISRIRGEDTSTVPVLNEHK